MFPNLDSRGFLPPGVHQACNWDSVAAVFAFNDHRKLLLNNMKQFIYAELQYVAAGLELAIGGSYLSTKSVPGDIDCTVYFKLEDICTKRPALDLLSNDGAKGRIWTQYRVEVYPTLEFPGRNDFGSFFQYVGEKSAVLHNCAATDKRGVLKVGSWLPG